VSGDHLDFDPRVDYYKPLGVAKTATADEIKKAFRKLAKQFHPDSTGGDKSKEARFKEITAAHEVLGDPKRRRQYDQLRADLASGRGMGGMGGPGGPGGMSGGFHGPGGQYFDLGDLFGQFFASGAAGPMGGGARPGGRGQASAQARRPPSADVTDVPFESKIKASDGSWLTVVGDDVHSDLRLGFDRAILGTVAEIATVDGRAQIKVPPGTPSGRKLRLRGKGAQPGGDHYVTVHIDVPTDLDEDARHLLGDLVAHLRRAGWQRAAPRGDKAK
jgi:DnaJ-class molecular chaperone